MRRHVKDLYARLVRLDINKGVNRSAASDVLKALSVLRAAPVTPDVRRLPYQAMFTGKQGRYYWLEQVNLRFGDVLKICPEFVEGKYLVITSFDSGSLTLTDEEFGKGWLQHDDLAINPFIESVNDIPYDEYDEWYIFSKAPLLEGFKVFVNDSLFSLRDPEYLTLDAAPTWDLVGRRDQAERVKDLQELFWLQLELKEPETYISAGDKFILATKKQDLYKKIKSSIRQISV